MKIGFIGVGNMGGAILRGYAKANPDQVKNICGVNRSPEKMQRLADELGVCKMDSIPQVTAESHMIVIGVKPHMVEGVFTQMEESMTPDKIIISIAAGITMEYIEQFFSGQTKVVRTMPNTPALVGAGMTALCRNRHITDEEFEAVSDIFRGVGRAREVSEDLMDAVGGVSGSSPAYAYLFIEALADAAVAEGMYRPQAYEFAAQAVLGAAEMVLKTGQHPGALKDAVCSPGGSTIEAVRALERDGFRFAVMDAVKTAADKTRNMKK